MRKNEKKLRKLVSLMLMMAILVSTCYGAMTNENVFAAVAKPALNKSSVNVLVGKTTQLALKKKIKKSSIVWKSNNKKIANVAKNGKVKGFSKGNAKITAMVTVNRKKYRLTCNVKVIQKAENIVITYNNGRTEKNVEMVEGEELSLKIKKSPKNSNDIVTSWNIGNKKVAKVNRNGKVTAVAEGTTTVTATMFGKAKASITIKVLKQDKDSENKNISTPTPEQTSTPSVTSTTNPPTTPTINPTTNPPTSPTTSPTKEPDPTPTPYPNDADLPDEIQNGEMALVYEDSFEEDTGGFIGRSASNTVSVTRVNTVSYDEDWSLHVTGRRDGWHGTQMNATNLFRTGNRYFVRGYVRHDENEDQNLKISLEYNYGAQGQNNTYPFVAETVCKKGEDWTQIQGFVEVKEGVPNINLYFEMPENKTANFYLDHVSIWEEKKEKEPFEHSLKDEYHDLFTIGAAVTANQLRSINDLDHILQQYNSVTMENEMKPSYLLNASNIINLADAKFEVPESYKEEKIPDLDFTTVDKCLSIAQENGLIMRGHTLVWHSQTPGWFFREGYSATGNLVSEEVMDARMEYYIKRVLDYVQTNYPGVIYAWDVVNEIFSEEGQMRVAGSGAGQSLWVSIYKDDEFAVKAFEYADKYREDGVKLFYNDYNEYMPKKRDAIVEFAKKLYDKGQIDGIGMQSHLDISYPGIDLIGQAIDAFNSVAPDFEVQLTEVDVTLNFHGNMGHTLEQQTEYYKELMKMVVAKRREGANITNVTFWGLYDEVSWRSPHQPLLFTTNSYIPKDSYYSVLSAVKGE